MATTVGFDFTVVSKGRRPFPIDMLRYDRCAPLAEEDSHKIEQTIRDDEAPFDGSEINLRCYDLGPRTPCTERWESFGWHVEWRNL